MNEHRHRPAGRTNEPAGDPVPDRAHVRPAPEPDVEFAVVSEQDDLEVFPVERTGEPAGAGASTAPFDDRSPFVLRQAQSALSPSKGDGSTVTVSAVERSGRPEHRRGAASRLVIETTRPIDAGAVPPGREPDAAAKRTGQAPRAVAAVPARPFRLETRAVVDVVQRLRASPEGLIIASASALLAVLLLLTGPLRPEGPEPASSIDAPAPVALDPPAGDARPLVHAHAPPDSGARGALVPVSPPLVDEPPPRPEASAPRADAAPSVPSRPAPPAAAVVSAASDPVLEPRVRPSGEPPPPPPAPAVPAPRPEQPSAAADAMVTPPAGVSDGPSVDVAAIAGPGPDVERVPVVPPVAEHAAPAVSAARPRSAAVQDVLNQYRDAFNALDPAAARAVWPSVDAAALGRAFDQLREQRLAYDDCRIAVIGDRADALCGGTLRYVTRLGGQRTRVEQREWAFVLRGAGDGWIIESVVTR